MALIAPYLTGMDFDEQQVKIVSRVIHAAGDLDYANHVQIHPDAVEAASAAIAAALTFTAMWKWYAPASARKPWPSMRHYYRRSWCCDPGQRTGITRSMAAFRTFGHRMDGAIVAVGNAPTALFELYRLMQEENVRPAMVIGVPVGFVGAAESKEMLAEKSNAPYITVQGNKGGSPIAASIFNALMYMIGPKAE